MKGNGISRSAVTDGFGDFWFDSLDTKLELVLEIEADGYKKIRKKIRTQNDVNVGSVFLKTN